MISVLKFYIPLGGGLVSQLLAFCNHFLHTSVVPSRDQAREARGEKNTPIRTTGRDEEVISGWLLEPSPTPVIGC